MSFTLRKPDGKRHWYARGTVPIRKASGEVGHVRVEISTREESKTRAARVAQDYWDNYQKEAFNPKPKVVSFTDACITYTETKNPKIWDRQILARLIQHFGDKPISEIGQTEVADAAARLYPGCKASTLHRSVYGPVTTVLRFMG